LVSRRKRIYSFNTSRYDYHTSCGLILNPAFSLESFFLQISLLLVANMFLLIPIALIAPFFALTGAIIASVVVRKYPENLFRNMLIVGTIIVIVADLIFFGI
jgi:hypothetical protein